MFLFLHDSICWRPHPRFPDPIQLRTSNTPDCINNLLWSRYFSHTSPIHRLNPHRPPACHRVMSRQIFISFTFDVTRHPSWPRLISYIWKAIILCHLRSQKPNPGTLWPYFISLESILRSPTWLKTCISITAFLTAPSIIARLLKPLIHITGLLLAHLGIKSPPPLARSP